MIEKHDYVRVANRVLPIELDGWFNNHMDISDQHFGILKKSYGNVEVFTEKKILPLTISFPYRLGSQIREIGLVKKKFIADFWIAGIPLNEVVDTLPKVVDYHVSIEVTLNSSSDSAGEFYSQFIRDGEESITTNEISQFIERKINNIICINSIADLINSNEYEALLPEDKKSELNLCIQKHVESICGQWNAALIVNLLTPSKRSLLDTSPIMLNEVKRREKIEKKTSIEKKHYGWITLLNGIGEIFQLAQIILALLAVFAGIFGAEVFIDILNSSLSIVVTVILLVVISVIMAKPTLRILAVAPERTNPLLGLFPVYKYPYISTRFIFIRPAIFLALGTWVIYEGVAPNWPVENSGSLFASMFFLMFLLIPDEWSRSARLRLFTFLTPFAFLSLNGNKFVAWLALFYFLVIFIIIVSFSGSEKDLLIALIIVFSPGLVWFNLSICIPLLIGFVVPKSPERVVFGFVAGFLAFSFGRLNLNIGLHVIFQSLYWSFIAMLVGYFAGQNNENYDFKKDFLIVLLGIAFSYFGILVSRIWFGDLWDNTLVNILWSACFVACFSILPRVLEFDFK